MLVEFAGLPGSGKSTTVRHLTADPSTARSVGLRKLGTRGVVQHPLAVTRAVLRWRSAAAQWSDKQALVSVLRRRISQDLLTERAQTPWLLEEGITHYIWRKLFLFPALSAEPWEPFLDVAYPLVALDADTALLHSRILTKGSRGQINERLVGLGVENADWDRAQDIYEQVLARASQYRPVVRVDATSDPSSTVARVRDVIRHPRGRGAVDDEVVTPSSPFRPGEA